jgi:small subunit ribosomal protein S4e
MSHLKRLTVPNSWRIKKKETIFIATPSPGPHRKSAALTLNIILKDMLKMAKTTREVKHILGDKKVLVDGKARKEYRFPVGVMDVVTIPALNEAYALLYSEKGVFTLKKLPSDPKEKLCKIMGKHILPKKKTQINLYDGRNVIVDKDSYKVGDTVVIADGKIKRHVKLEKGALVYLIGGKHIGTTGKLTEIKTFKGMENDRIIMETKKGKIETLKDYAFVVEKEW